MGAVAVKNGVYDAVVNGVAGGSSSSTAKPIPAIRWRRRRRSRRCNCNQSEDLPGRARAIEPYWQGRDAFHEGRAERHRHPTSA